LKAYQAFAHLLLEDLGIQPERETQELYQSLKASHLREPSPRQVQAPPPALVGRQQEWQRLQAAWRQASAGNPHLFFIYGEAGIGKSRLAEELVGWAERQAIRTAVAPCYPAEGNLPYAPAMAWLRAHPLPTLEELWLAEISRLLPEVLSNHPQLKRPGSLTEAWQRQRLFEALARALLGCRQKLLLVIEDLQWCDQDTLEWLHYLLRFDPQAPLMVVATVRSEETTPEHPLQDFQAVLAASGKSSLVELKPLNEAESFQLASQIAAQTARQALDPELAAHIYRQTEGYPLFVVETVRLGHPLQSEGQMVVEPAPLSEKVQAVLNRRLTQLSPPTRELACLAATIGRQFTLNVLRQASGIAEEALVSGLDELLLRRVIGEVAADRFDFSHDKLREAAFAGLSTAHRRLLHRRVAEAYVNLASGQPETNSGEIASHYDRAGLALPAIHYYRLAARAAASIFANLDAIHSLQRTIALAEPLTTSAFTGGITHQELAALYETLGDLLALTGDYTQALENFTHASNQPFSQGQIWKSTIYRKISAVQVSLYRHQDAYASLDQGEKSLEFVEDSSSPEERQEWFNLQLARGQLFYWDNDLPAMNHVLQKVKLLIEQDGWDNQRLELLSIDYQYHLRLERYRLSQTTVDLARRRRDLCLATDDRSNITYANFQLGFALLWQGEAESAQQYLTAALTSAEAMGARTIQARCLTYLSIASRKLKQIEALHSQSENLLKLTEAIGEHAYQGVAWANKAWLAWRDGNAEQAVEFGQAAHNCWDKYPGAYVFFWLSLWPLLAVAVENRHLDEAQIRARGMLDSEQQPLLEPLPQLLSDAIQAYQVGDEPKAIRLFQQALEGAKQQGDL